MDPRYTIPFLLLPVLAQAQPQLPGFSPQDTVTINCPLDSTIQILTYSDWEAYQTVDDLWNGPRDSTVCVDLAHVQGQFVYSYIDVDQIDAARPVFLRWRSDSANAIHLTPDNEYALDMGNWSSLGFDGSNACPGGACTGWRAAVRIPHWSGVGTDLRWYQSTYNPNSWSGSPFHLCIPTEHFAQNDLMELVVSFKASTTVSGQRFQLAWPDITDLTANANLTPLTQNNLADYQNGPSGYYFYPNWANNFLVMYPDTTYPDINHERYLDFAPIPNTTDSQQVQVSLDPSIGFNFQPFTQLRGGLVLGSDSLRHSIDLINNGADICLSYSIVEVILGPGDSYTHVSGHVDLGGDHACIQFKPNSTLEVAAGSTFHYGEGGRGMLFLRAGSHVQLDANAELDLRGTLVLGPRPDATGTEDLRVVLKDGAKLTFAPGSKIVNASGFGQGMMLEVVLDGGSADLSGLSGPDRLKEVHVIELPSTAVSPVKVLGNPVDADLAMEMSVRHPGTWSAHAIDMAGRTVAEASFYLSEGGNTINLPTTAWHAGSYLLELRNGDERQVVRVVKQ